ncbi:MAG: hypothetical protein JWP37_1723 [Mucilaginibacter sp.]|nr:hypothetical protein [Mucilaginibacter sp.]
MDETSTTTTLKETLNMATMKELDATENLEADELIFYHSLRNDLDLLKKNPSLQTIHHILNYSKSLR